MSDSDPPDSPGQPGQPGQPGGPGGKRRRLEGVIPDLLKRAIEIGVDKAQDAPESLKHLVGELKVPKEIAGYLFTQIDETKNGLFRVVAKEIRDFLEHTNISSEMQKILTTVQFEINTTVRFTPNDGSKPEGTADAETDLASEKPSEVKRMAKPEVKTQVNVKGGGPRERRRARE
jgi:hypothetical protein